MVQERFTVAAVQTGCTEDVGRNVARAIAGVRDAAAAGARLIVLPERFAYPAEGAPFRASAERIPGELTQALSALARELGIVLVAGSMLERVPGKRKFYNTSLVFDEGGEVIARYRKIHLFRIRAKATGVISETRRISAGDREVIADTSLGRVGLSICYDLRFPEMYRALARGGAEVVTVPSAFTRMTGRAHWRVLLRARAIENQCYVVAAGQCGTVSGHAFYGHSAIIDPWGRVLAEAGARPAMITATIRKEMMRDVRRRLPSLRDSMRMEGKRIAR